MPQRTYGLYERIRRCWYRLRGERPLLITFWPQDYPRGTSYQVDGTNYQITRYFHAADYRFFEVWGREETRLAQRSEETPDK